MAKKIHLGELYDRELAVIRKALQDKDFAEAITRGKSLGHLGIKPDVIGTYGPKPILFIQEKTGHTAVYKPSIPLSRKHKAIFAVADKAENLYKGTCFFHIDKPKGVLIDVDEQKEKRFKAKKTYPNRLNGIEITETLGGGGYGSSGAYGGIRGGRAGIHGGLRGRRNFEGLNPCNVCYSALDGRRVRGARNLISEKTDFGEYIGTSSKDVDIDVVKKDFKELKLKSETKPELYMELADRFYFRFKSAVYPEIHYTKTCIRIDSEDPDDFYAFQFNMVDPGAFLVSLYVLHLALKDKWDEGDDMKAQRLRERIDEVYPEHTSFLARITCEIEEMSSERFLEEHQDVMKNYDCKTGKGAKEVSDDDKKAIDEDKKASLGIEDRDMKAKEPDEDFLLKEDLPTHFSAEMRKNRKKQFNLQYCIGHEILDMIHPKKKMAKNQKWNWALVMFAMIDNGLLINESIKESEFADCIYHFLPLWYIEEKLENKEDEEKGKANIRASIKQQVYNHKDDRKISKSMAASVRERIDKIKKLLSSRGLYLSAA